MLKKQKPKKKNENQTNPALFPTQTQAAGGAGFPCAQVLPSSSLGGSGNPPKIHPLIPEERDGKAKALITEHKHRPFNMWKYF